MSKVSITGNNAGSGTFTIAAPNSNNNRQIDLPDLAGTVLTDATDLEPQVKTATNATGSAPIYACRAWVNYNAQTSTVAASGNVSSIQDVGTGKYAVNFSTPMQDNNYCVVTNHSEGGERYGNFGAGSRVSANFFNRLNGFVDVGTTVDGSGFFDMRSVEIAVFR